MKIQAPNAFVLICAVLVFVGVLTWIVPPGRYERVDKKTPAGTKSVVVEGSYRALPPEQAAPQDPWDWLQSPIRAFSDPKHTAAEIVGFILLVGGAFGVLHKTGAILAAIAWLTARAGPRNRFAMIPVLMFAFSLGGALFGMAEETIPFILVTVPLAVALGFDVLTGIAIPFFGSQLGFSTAFVNPFTLGIAKGIAAQPIEEGYHYRLLLWAITTTLGAALIVWHAARVARDPSRSLTPQLDAYWRGRVAEPGSTAAVLTRRHVLVLAAFAAAMITLGYGSTSLDWYITELAALFLAMALVCGLIGGLRPGQTADAFVDGAKDLCGAAVLVAFSRAVLVVAEDGKIIDPILNWASGSMSELSPVAASEVMLLFQSGMNFFVPSGSGQAALVMPIMAPLSDLVHVHRENAILAFQFGDGFTNLIVPTNAVLMGVLSVAKMEYATWFRWIWKVQLGLLLLSGIYLALSPFHA
jgi:uncharacterized ion transporter superfamily protein YfcC